MELVLVFAEGGVLLVHDGNNSFAFSSNAWRESLVRT